MATFKIGDQVTWTSSAAGVTKTKVGQVTAIILPGNVPASVKGTGGPRKHESYVVFIPNRGKGKFYWPVASLLRPVAP